MADAEQLAVTLDAVGDLIAAVGDGQWTNPTPCDDWNVADLVDHVVAGNHLFARAIAAGSEAGEQSRAPDDDRAGAGRAGAYRASAAALLRAFRGPGALEKTVTVPFGSVPGIVALNLRLTELLVHGWDIGRATGQEASFPDDIVEQELAFSRAALGEVPPDRSPFAPPQAVANEAPAIDRLAACLGRNPEATTGPLDPRA